MVPYVYRPFPDTDYIRLLTLESGAYDDDIVVHISRVPFDPACPPQYEALSYVWGSEENKKTVFVGNRGRSRVTVTRNLDVALRHLRYDHKEPRVMWIDAICIDQKNDQEKGPQVARMGQVFKCAARVLVWLGPEQNHSDLAMQLISAKLDIRPDYTKPAAFVYKDATRKYILQFGLEILRQCQFTTNISNPSWVPDWTTKSEASRGFLYTSASSQLVGCSHFLDSDILSVAGTVVTAVGTLYDLDGEHEQLYTHDFSESLRKLFIQIDPNTDENKDDAVAIYAELLYADGPNLRMGFARDNNQDLADLTRFLSRLYTNGVQSALNTSRTVAGRYRTSLPH
ncbi:putative Heterokaryon incompatibility protein-domain-containing protein [Seiridium unicorne]|uniref:Heterokaryon incompatibility protein-domain-containing protein n=1 Tax=Seiridium unicorne TaxID=138068 RepID=A0ABR2UTK6_9PEZI